MFPVEFTDPDHSYCQQHRSWLPSFRLPSRNQSTWVGFRRKSCLNTKNNTCEVEYNDGKMCVFEVAGDEAFEAFLTGGVPKLETDHLSGDTDVFRDKVDADGGLRGSGSTFLVGSNSLRM